LLEGDASALDRLASKLLKPLNNNLVERPWGGRRILELKGMPNVPVSESFRIGEAFEISADDRDAEARQYPSRLRFSDGSELTLPALLGQHAAALLGPSFVRRYGACFPLLPKTLDIAELLSVQAHPEGNTEVYVIIAADPGATIRLGFKEDVDPADLEQRLTAGRREQQRLLDLVAAGADQHELQRRLKPWLAQRSARAAALEPALRPLLRGGDWPEVEACVSGLHALYWEVLDSLNEIPVAAGQVIHNANPRRIVTASGRAASAEVHALGNPEAREILALEIRRPGPTFRAWDNVRFPLREIDVAGAIAALNLRRTAASEFIVEPRPVEGRPGVKVSVDSEHFRLEHLAPPYGAAIDVAAEQPHSLHALHGAVTVRSVVGAMLGELVGGESALVPAKVGAYRVTADTAGAQLLKVSLPDAR
jgi:hypothetical protein